MCVADDRRLRYFYSYIHLCLVSFVLTSEWTFRLYVPFSLSPESRSSCCAATAIYPRNRNGHDEAVKILILREEVNPDRLDVDG